MRQKVKTLIKNTAQDIIKSPELILMMLRTYSTLYLNGGQARSCIRSVEVYLTQLKKNGMEKIDILEEAEKRTLIPAWSGLMYVNSIRRHLSSQLINDKEAISYLKDGVLSESSFEKLPENYKSKSDFKKSEKPAQKKRYTSKKKK